MLRPLVALACIGLAPLRRSRIGPAERRAVMGWLARTAPRWGRGRWWAACGLTGVAIAGLAIGSAASLPIYQWVHVALWGTRFETLAELWEDLSEEAGRAGQYDWAVVAHAALAALAFALLLLAWIRLGARAALLRRGACAACRHDLTGLPIESDESASPTVRCTECGRPNPAIAAWGELSRDAAGRVAFAPAMGLLRVFWTRRRAVLTGKLAAALIALSLMAGGGVWGWRYADSHRQAAAAKAARLTPERITERVSALMAPRVAAHVSPPLAGDSRLDTLQRIADRSRDIAYAYNARHGLSGMDGPTRQVWIDSAWPSRQFKAEGGGEAATIKHGAALLEELRADGLESLLDALASTPPPPPFQYVPEDAGGMSTTHLAAVRQAARLNAAFLRCAASVGDAVGFQKRLETAIALCELSSERPFLIDTLVTAALVQAITEHLDWATRIRQASDPTDDWFDAIDSALARLQPPDSVGGLRRERLYCLDNLAAHFSDAARVRRGMADPTIADAPDFLNFIMDPNGTRKPPPPARLGSFDANARAMNDAFENVANAASSSVWLPERYDTSRFDGSTLHFVRQLAFLPELVKGNDRVTLALRSVRITARIERFRAVNGRVPTPEELPAAVGPGIDLTDPYTGKPLGYRTTNLPKLPDRWPARGYMLYAAGLDGIDHGGAVPPRQPDLPARSAKGEHDLILPDALLSP